jgi:hypothetical protein
MNHMKIKNFKNDDLFDFFVLFLLVKKKKKKQYSFFFLASQFFYITFTAARTSLWQMQSKNIQLYLADAHAALTEFATVLSNDKETPFYMEWGSGFDGQERQDLKKFLENAIEDAQVKHHKNHEFAMQQMKDECQNLKNWGEVANPDDVKTGAMKISYYFLYRAVRSVCYL